MSWPAGTIRSVGLGLLCAGVSLAGGWAARTHAAPEAETAETTTSWQVTGTSRVSLLGSEKGLATQTLPTGPGTPPKNWKTLNNLVLPRVQLAFGQYVEFVQNGTAQGVIESATGKVTLDLPLMLRDSTQSTQTFTAYLTTGQTNGVNSDGSPGGGIRLRTNVGICGGHVSGGFVAV